uniref:Uncharacterized protein LOC100175813 n=1 Tax=Phallusia mammillata TaxID=59560 RepID=A0A6F9DFM5_9ASCI|nr:uncharacterized protein LOC100175813 [Phallusia mammillata]
MVSTDRYYKSRTTTASSSCNKRFCEMAESNPTTEVLPVTTKDFYNLLKKAQNELQLRDEDISGLDSVKQIKSDGIKWSRRNAGILYAGFAFLIIFGLPSSIYMSIKKETSFGQFVVSSYFEYMGLGPVDQETCVVTMHELMQDPFRPPVDCSACQNVTGVKIVSNLSHDEFLDKYAFSMQPVLIKDGQDGWTATETFSFEYFHEIYKPGSEALEKVKNDCQFFPYRTEFNDLEEFFSMDPDRVAGKAKPWYVGWSNCDGKAANELRKHYRLPYFLPRELDHSKTDWVFMGLPGYGANMHIDFVGALSWQAQVKGTKKWMLETPPECWGTCISSMEIIVKPGDIIVLDTNKWFHATEIVGNDTSIVIGSEYY